MTVPLSQWLEELVNAPPTALDPEPQSAEGLGRYAFYAVPSPSRAPASHCFADPPASSRDTLPCPPSAPCPEVEVDVPVLAALPLDLMLEDCRS